ncbi:phage tail sheath family protein [Clostridium butyricum]|uniref:phage tail sheath family protein n=1 Tax=Clostridium butyricum TaxID=1492 RepID=UPI000412ECF3|nr:phage tail sheath family protein [Clostridium butyricum]
MALGGGTWITQNKVLNGTYVNFISAARADATLSDRGYAALPMELDWGVDEEVFTVTQEEFQKDSLKIFGYEYTSDKLKGLRDLFLNATVLYAYKINKGVKASCTYATAKYSGIMGNKITLVITKDIDDESLFNVTTYFCNKEIETQIVSRAIDLVSNDYVDFKTDTTLEATSGMNLTGGTNGESVTGSNYQTFLDKIEAYNYNTLGCLSTDEAVKSLFASFTKRLRDQVGAKFQTVLYKYEKADYEGVISVDNKVKDKGELESSLVYWTLGAECGCAVNKSVENRKYIGEFTVEATGKQEDLKAAIKAGKFVFHKVGDDIRVLNDINTLITYTTEKGSDFSMNQVMRVLDQVANDTAVLFNTKYLGEFPNDASGRVSLWNDIVDLDKKLQKIRAIEDFTSDDVIVEKGETKKAVLLKQTINPTVAMGQLYMACYVA